MGKIKNSVKTMSYNQLILKTNSIAHSGLSQYEIVNTEVNSPCVHAASRSHVTDCNLPNSITARRRRVGPEQSIPRAEVDGGLH